MNRLELDFAPRNLRFWSARASLTVWAALVGAVLALGAGLWALAAVRAERLGLQETLVRTLTLPTTSVRGGSTPAVTGALRIDAAKFQAMNQALLALNRPWSELWDALERVSSARGVEVAILEMRPEATTSDQEPGIGQGLRLLAEAKDSTHMLDFVSQLRGEPFFRSVVLISHQIYAQDPNRPLRFELSLRWSQVAHE
jgi:hypothetical protein